MRRFVTLVALFTTLCCALGLASAAAPQVLFKDGFNGSLDKGWRWLRENPGAWRFEDGGLAIRVEPGVAHNVKNALVRAAPDRTKGTYAIDVTVTNHVLPTRQYEQAGITWYNGGRPVFKIVKERINGKLYIIPGKKPMDAKSVQLRLVVSPKGFVAQYRPDGTGEFKTAAAGNLPPPKNDEVSIQCYNGPPDQEHWIRFSDFRITDLEPAVPARPFLHPLFTDHMVLPRNVPAPVWGWAAPNTEVAVSIAGTTAKAQAGADGRWQATLKPLKAGGPHTLEVTGPQRVVLNDVLVGDVWLCSGQSNMQWSLSNSNNAAAEIAAANHPRIRLFTVPMRPSLEPQELMSSGEWVPCNPQTIPGFTAVGYFFGRELHKKLDVPIGLINSSWGGTIAEAWTSGEALNAMDDFRPAVTQLRELAASLKAGTDTFEELVAKWWSTNDPGSTAGANWAAAAQKDADWKTMNLPAPWEASGLAGFDGIVWFRREVTVPAAWAGKKAVLRLGPIDDRDTTFLNGKRVGQHDVWTQPRTYTVPAGTLVAGRNVIAVRVLDTGGGGGILGNPAQFTLRADGSTDAPIPLAGAWKYRVGAPLSKLSPPPRRPNSNPNVVTVLYNGMIAPLVPFAIKGAIWYQGESNAGRAEQYRTLLPTMIRDWRTRFGVGQFPFFVVQLANFLAPQKEPSEGGWATLREAQFLTAQADPKVGLAVIIDIGDARDIRPRNKQDVGRRLALSAQRIAYGHDVVSSGPEYASMTVRGNEVSITFRHVGGGLMAKGGDTLKGFAIAGADGKFVWAKARIEGTTVKCSSPDVPKPTAVRYGWANNPDCNLFNKEGLPASSFRTDTR